MQRQLRLGDILDDYCPRERRVTNHAIVAMLGSDVKQTRCTTCDAEHEYKQAKVPRQRRKTESPAALYAAVLTNGPKRVAHGGDQTGAGQDDSGNGEIAALESLAGTNGNNGNGAPGVEERHAAEEETRAAEVEPGDDKETADLNADRDAEEDGPVHRPLIRASLPRPDGTPPPQRPAPDFTIRQPGGRAPNRFRGRHQRGGQQFQGHGNRGNGNMSGPPRGGIMRQGGGAGRPQGNAQPRPGRRTGPGRNKRPK